MKDLNKITFEERRIQTLAQLYHRWCEDFSGIYGEEYSEVLDGLARWLDHVTRVEYEFDTCRGYANVVMEGDYYPACEHEKQLMRHVFQELDKTLEEAREPIVYRFNDKKRVSKVRYSKNIIKTGLTIEYLFWEIFEELLNKAKRKYYTCKEEIDIKDELEEFYNEVLSEFMDKIVDSYDEDLSKENFLESLEYNYPEVWEQVKGELSND